MANSNNAVFLTAKNVPLKLRPSTYTPPREDEIVVRNVAVAINPFDWIMQEAHSLVAPWVTLPFVLGTDVAGDVIEAGRNVSRFKVGDRVVGQAIGVDKRVNRACEGGFQEYTVLRQHMTSPIPQSISYERACVMPLALSTAACGLFAKDYLALPFPTTSSPTQSGKTLLIWGGSTSVGCNAIQLATAAGYEVIATASSKNHDYLKKLGAVEVFDYHSTTVIPDIISAFRYRTTAGALSIGPNTLRNCIDILGGCKGNRFVAYTTPDTPPFPKSNLEFPLFLLGMVSTTVATNVRSFKKGVRAKMINGANMNEVGKAMYEDFLPKALEQNKFVPAPDPQVVGKGLEYVQKAIVMSKKGVSAKKLVVTL